MKEKTTIEIAPSPEDIILVQALADGKGAMKMAVENDMSTNKTYEKISLAKAKYNAVSNENLVAIFFRNNLIK